ncbi:unnamed protein product [Ixodes persulcatus]
MAEFFFIPSPILFPPTNPRPRWGTDVRATFLGGGGYCGSGCCIVAAVFEERALPCFRGNGGTKTKTTTQTKRNGTTHSLHGSCLERHREREREREMGVTGTWSSLPSVFLSFGHASAVPPEKKGKVAPRTRVCQHLWDFPAGQGGGGAALPSPWSGSAATRTHARHHSFSSRRSKHKVQLKRKMHAQKQKKNLDFGLELASIRST